MMPPPYSSGLLAFLFRRLAKHRQPELAAQVYRRLCEERRGDKEPWPLSTGVYISLLNVFAKSEHPPYGVSERWARQADAVAEEALASGIRPPQVLFHTWMECLAKAGEPEAARRVLERMHSAGVRADAYTFTILFTALRRAGQTQGAREIFERLIPLVCVGASGGGSRLHKQPRMHVW